ncbi:hypothetical protein [Paenibacillus sp. V4I7]|uniref:hypothetical protein n=1 Tax=Paenibacillus sp. V4I7 TaxID=3042307 RepID=UPI0027D7B3E8|nr:hypothetical protein [Paenibacillus sp. V4I7]
MSRIWLILVLISSISGVLFVTGCKNTPSTAPSATYTPNGMTTPTPGSSSEVMNPSTPTSISNTSEPPVKNEQKVSSLASKNLEITLASTKEGFRIDHDETFGFYLMQTLPTPRGDAVLHVVRRMDQSTANDAWFRKDLVLIKPETKEVQIYTLMNGYTTDSYSTDSITQVLGFIDQEHIIYAAIHGDQDTPTTYNIEKMNVYSGEMEVLFNNQPDNVSPDFYMPGWLNDKKEKLVINSFKEGTTWVFDLLNHNVIKLEEKFKNTWPQFALFPSPDGNLFWYHGKLYNIQGQLIYAPNSLGRIELGLYWSPDSRYTVRHFANDDKPENLLSGGENGILTPQSLTINDRTGKIVQQVETNDPKVHLELVGWISDQQAAVIQYYEIDRSRPEDDQKTKVNYKLMNLLTGVQKTLSPTKLEDLTSSTKSRVRTYSCCTAPEIPFFVDTNNSTFWRSEDRAIYLGQFTSGEHVWNVVDHRHAMTKIYVFSPLTKKIRTLEDKKTISDIRLFLKSWVFDTGNLTYQKLEMK